jgi:hypothetical protein
MLKRSMVLKAAVVCAAVVGIAQASIITMDLTPTNLNSHDLSWQNIEAVSYSWNDINNNGILEVGETGQLNVTMGKNLEGTHDYDALKVWVDGKEINTPTPTDNFNLHSDPNATDKFMWDIPGASDAAWTGGNKTFSFNYNFIEAKTYDVIAAVMCSRDLSNLYNPTWPANDAPTIWDWNNWYTDTDRFQGETNKYQITVKENVPEPGSLSLLLLGLSGLAGSLFIRRRSK